jgi:signal transduction histidine kinase
MHESTAVPAPLAGRSGDGAPPRFLDNALFDGLPAALREAAAALPVPVHAAEGKTIFDEGEPGDALYVVASGCVRISMKGRAGEQETLHFVPAGDFFGEMAVCEPGSRSARATATEDTVLGRVDSATFQSLVELSPVTVTRNLLGTTIRRLRGADELLMRRTLESERLSLLGTMLGGVMHDIGNALSSVTLVSSALEERAGDVELQTYSGYLSRAAKRITEMSREVLEFSRGTPRLDLELVPVAALLLELDELALRLLPARGIAVERRIDFRGSLWIDLGRFARAVVNLIKNAAEAMPDGGTLTISLREEEGHAVLGVRDTGRGISPELLPRIFEPFVTHGKAGGTGLGMPIVRNIVAAHGARISVESEPGRGTSFTLSLPLPTG